MAKRKSKREIRELDSLIAKLEGGLSQAKLSDVRQIRKIVCALEASHRVKIALVMGKKYLKLKAEVFQDLESVVMRMAIAAYNREMKKIEKTVTRTGVE